MEFIENGYEFYGIEKYGVCWEIMWEYWKCYWIELGIVVKLRVNGYEIVWYEGGNVGLE